MSKHKVGRHSLFLFMFGLFFFRFFLNISRIIESRSCQERMGKRKGVTETSQRPKKFKQWLDESMLQAIEAIKEGTLGLNEASRCIGQP